jgi:hypothetical protein
MSTKSSLRAVPTPGFAKPPYHVESFPGFDEHGWHCVCNKNDVNCLHFPDKPSAVFTTLEHATALCAQWNAEQHVLERRE